jgi:hypothetical protein
MGADTKDAPIYIAQDQGRSYVFHGPWAKSTKGTLNTNICVRIIRYIAICMHTFTLHEYYDRNNIKMVAKYNNYFLIV